MTSNMLACYPEVFAAGAIVAGLPYGAATLRAASVRNDVSKSLEAGAGMGRSCAECLAAPWTMATHFSLARKCRQDRDPAERAGNHQAVD